MRYPVHATAIASLYIFSYSESCICMKVCSDRAEDFNAPSGDHEYVQSWALTWPSYLADLSSLRFVEAKGARIKQNVGPSWSSYGCSPKVSNSFKPELIALLRHAALKSTAVWYGRAQLSTDQVSQTQLWQNVLLWYWTWTGVVSLWNIVHFRWQLPAILALGLGAGQSVCGHVIRPFVA